MGYQMKVGDLVLVSGGRSGSAFPMVFYLAEIIEKTEVEARVELLASTSGKWSGSSTYWENRGSVHPISDIFIHTIPQQRWGAREIIRSYFEWR
jgi:hypothetical protein